MKKRIIISIILITVLCFVTGCGKSENRKEETQAKEILEKTSKNNKNKILVVYFSKTGENYNVGKVKVGNSKSPININYRNKKSINNKIFKNYNQKSYININFYTSNSIFQKGDQESEFNNSNTNRYTLNNNNNSNIHHLNNISTNS